MVSKMKKKSKTLQKSNPLKIISKIGTKAKTPKSTPITNESTEYDSFDDLEDDYNNYEDDDFEDIEEEEESDASFEKDDEIENEEEEELEDEEDLGVEEDTDDDEEEEEEENSFESGGKITQKMIENWDKALSSNNKTAILAFKSIQHALSAAVESINEEGEKKKSVFKTRNPKTFNDIVRLCLKKVPPALHRLFEFKTLSDRPVRNKKWHKLKNPIKSYLKDIILLIKYISEPTMIEVILKRGVLPILPFFAEFPTISWNLIQQVATLWCTSHEKVRVLSVVVLFRLMTSLNKDHKERVLKLLYVSFVKNCRFTSPSTWPMIDFMRLSLVELYCMDEALAYRHAFVYIRQLACHLRNAMLVQKKERMQLVYNWQFLHCIHFWCDLLGKAYPSSVLQPLIYPVVQIANGMLNLMKSPKYYPLTFHVCNILTELSEKTGVFIPVLPYILEILQSEKLRSMPKKISMKPFIWNCIIKVSQSQLGESAFTDGLIEQIFESSLRYLNSQCNSIGFPELVFPFTLYLKTFLKKCKVANYTRKIKQILDKLNENADFISSHRKNVVFTITDAEAIRNWEIEMEQNLPPFRAFYNQWKEMTKTLRETEKETIEKGEDKFSISAVRRRRRNDDDDEEEEEVEADKPAEKKMKIQSKKPETPRTNEDFDDIVKEMSLSEFDDDDE